MTNKNNTAVGGVRTNLLAAENLKFKRLKAINTNTGELTDFIVYDEEALHADNLADNLITTEDGFALNAKQGKVIGDRLSDINANNAGAHNSIYRGKSLGSAVTAAQWAAIAAGTFEDMYIGDYWTIRGVNYRIAAFDYYYNTGDTNYTTHHVVVVPDTALYSAQMNTTNVVTGGYTGSAMRTANLETAKTTIAAAFGSAHILSHRLFLSNAVSSGYESGAAWFDSTVELMTEQNVYGGKIFSNGVQGTNFAYNHTVDKSQYPLFAMRPDLIGIRNTYWLRNVANSADFARVDSTGLAAANSASASHGVRPAFSIC